MNCLEFQQDRAGHPTPVAPQTATAAAACNPAPDRRTTPVLHALPTTNNNNNKENSDPTAANGCTILTPSQSIPTQTASLSPTLYLNGPLQFLLLLFV